MYQPIRGQGGYLVFPIGPQNTDLVEDFKIFASCKVWLTSKMSQPISGHLVFPISPKNTSLVEDVEILLPVEFH